MSNALKISKIGMGISAAAFIFAATAMVIAGFEWVQIITACGLFCLFCANFTIYMFAKNKDKEDEQGR